MKTSFGSAALVSLALGSAMAFYAVSLHVAAERAGIDKVRAQIVADSHDIRMLQAELRTRARLPELQRWNEQVPALAPPKPNQFIDSPLVLASYTPPSGAKAPAVQFAAAHPAPKADSPMQQVAYREPSVAGGQAVPAAKLVVPAYKKAVAAALMSAPVTSTSVTGVAKVVSATATATATAPRKPKPIVVASAEPVPSSSIGLDATLGGQLAAAAAQEHATRVSYTLR